jgi:predicted phosphoadenosine phosphosulfate sulfurtransferase
MFLFEKLTPEEMRAKYRKKFAPVILKFSTKGIDEDTILDYITIFEENKKDENQ